jgi:hypothetical protein
MLEALMGLPSQSFVPYSKLKLFRVHCSLAVHLLTRLKSVKNPKKLKVQATKLFSVSKAVLQQKLLSFTEV